MTQRVIAFVFARGGSKGLPGKNIHPLHGKPLIAHSIDVANELIEIERVIVSTDDPGICAVSKQFGAEVPFLRPAELATDTAAEWLCWQHAVRFMIEKIGDFDVFISLPATAPLRTTSDVEICLETFKTGNFDTVVTVTDANRHPDFNMLRRVDGHFERVGKSCVTRRQDAAQVFDMTTVAYVTSPEFILNNTSIFDGNIGAVNIPKARAIDIDDEIDFRFAESIPEDLRRKSLAQPLC